MLAVSWLGLAAAPFRGPLPLQARRLLGLLLSLWAPERERAESPLLVLVDLLAEGLLLLLGEGDPNLSQHGGCPWGRCRRGGWTRFPYHCRQLLFGLLHLLLALHDLGVDSLPSSLRRMRRASLVSLMVSWRPSCLRTSPFRRPVACESFLLHSTPLLLSRRGWGLALGELELELHRQVVLELLQQLQERVLLKSFLLLSAGIHNPLALELVLNRSGKRIPVLLPDLSSLDPTGSLERGLGEGKGSQGVLLVRRLRRRAGPLCVAGPGFRPRSPALLAVSSHAFLDLIGVYPSSATGTT